jgi:hypothetical protein
MTTTYTVTVQKRLTLQQTYTLTAGSEQEARRRAREHASEANAVTSQTDWRVTDVEISASAEEVTDLASGDRS